MTVALALGPPYSIVMNSEITLGMCVNGAWRDAAGAVRSRPALFLLLFLLWFASSYFVVEAQLLMQASIAETDRVARGTLLRYGQFRALAAGAVQWCLLLVIAAQIIRYVLRDTTSSVSQKGSPLDAALFRYAGAYFLLALAAAVLAVVITLFLVLLFRMVGGALGLSLGSIKALAFTMGTLVVCGAMYVVVRLSLLFTNRAMGGRAPLRAAWRLTQGHFWAMTVAHVLAALPALGIGMIVGLIGVLVVRAGLAEGVSLTIVLAFLRSVSTLIGLGVAAACSAWLYRRFGAAALNSRS